MKDELARIGETKVNFSSMGLSYSFSVALGEGYVAAFESAFTSDEYSPKELERIGDISFCYHLNFRDVDILMKVLEVVVRAWPCRVVLDDTFSVLVDGDEFLARAVGNPAWRVGIPEETQED